MPLQTVAARGVRGVVEIEEEFAGGLADVDGFSHLLLLTHLHRAPAWAPWVVPFLDDRPRGVFATRSPRRPNPIGLSIVRLERIEGRRVHVLDVDLLDGTPLLDLKPYVPRFDDRVGARIGWFAGASKRRMPELTSRGRRRARTRSGRRSACYPGGRGGRRTTRCGRRRGRRSGARRA